MRLIVFASQENSEYYRQELEKVGVEFDILHELVDVYDSTGSDRYYNGLVIDAHSLAKAKQGEKTIIESLWRIYPALVTKLSPDLELVPLSTQKFSGSLADFVRECKAFPPRPIRSHDRANLHLHVLLSRTPDFTAADPTFTMNVSESGCFVVTTKGWEVGEQVWIRIVEFDDDSPVSATIRWCASWGRGHHVPGIGVEFHEVRREQLEKLKFLILSTWVAQKGN